MPLAVAAISLTPSQRAVALLALVGAALEPTFRIRRRRQRHLPLVKGGNDDAPDTPAAGTGTSSRDAVVVVVGSVSDETSAGSLSGRLSLLLLVCCCCLLRLLQARSQKGGGGAGGGEAEEFGSNPNSQQDGSYVYNCYNYWEVWIWIVSLALSIWLGRNLADWLANATCYYCSVSSPSSTTNGTTTRSWTSSSAVAVVLQVRLAIGRGGPLGCGCRKLWEALVSSGMMMVLMMTMTTRQDISNLQQEHTVVVQAPTFLTFGKPLYQQSWKVWIWLLALCFVVNGVLWLWSRHARRVALRTSADTPIKDHFRKNSSSNDSRDTSASAPASKNDSSSTSSSQVTRIIHHPGVEQMVETTLGRSLSATEHVQLAFLAILNAICEEVTSRGVWRWYFGQLFLSWDLFLNNNNNNHNNGNTHENIHYHYYYNYSNFCQAMVFGMWHYYGIPSGLIGVALTFIYGGLMGLLADYNEGLGLAIVAHSLADYYIFAGIARQGHNQGKSKLKMPSSKSTSSQSSKTKQQ